MFTIILGQTGINEGGRYKTRVPTKSESREVIRFLRRGKVPGADIINVELLKTDETAATEMLNPFLA